MALTDIQIVLGMASALLLAIWAIRISRAIEKHKKDVPKWP